MTEHAAVAEINYAERYRLLSRAFGVPDEELLAYLSTAQETFAGACSGLAEHAPREKYLAQLQVDYSRLFVGPFKLLAPPYGSLYLEHTGRLMGDSTVDVRMRYKEEGLDVALSEVPDHVAIELEFAHFLAAKAARAFQESDLDEAARCAAKRMDFLSTHLGAWVGDFAANIKEHARTAFYKALGHATEAFVMEDLARLRIAA